MTTVDWSLRGPTFSNCNCAFGCPCQFNSPPTYGNCQAVTGMRIEEGRFGDIAVELDALPGQVLEDRIREEVEARIDLDALEAMRGVEREERGRLVRALGEVSS